MLATILALGVGLGRLRLAPRTLLVTDCLLRAVTFGWLGVLAVTGRLTLPVLVGGLLGGAAFRMVGSSSRRVLATSMAGEGERFAVNGLLGLNSNVALYVLGPAAGGLLVATAGAGTALFADACGALVLLATVLRSVPRAVAARGEARRGPSGWRILRRRPAAARLLVVVFFFNLLYMPIEVALTLYVRGGLHAGASGLGLLWGALGVGAAAGAARTNQLRNLPQRHPLIAIIALWGLCPIALAATPSLPVAMIESGLGGLVWAPFTPVAYSYLQGGLATREQRQVVTLWTTGATVAAPARPGRRRTTGPTDRNPRRPGAVRHPHPAPGSDRRRRRPDPGPNRSRSTPFSTHTKWLTADVWGLVAFFKNARKFAPSRVGVHSPPARSMWRCSGS